MKERKKLSYLNIKQEKIWKNRIHRVIFLNLSNKAVNIRFCRRVIIFPYFMPMGLHFTPSGAMFPGG